MHQAHAICVLSIVWPVVDEFPAKIAIARFLQISSIMYALDELQTSTNEPQLAHKYSFTRFWRFSV